MTATNAATKNILASKTFWVQIVALASMAVPAIRSWLAANPVEYLSAFAGVNLLVRFATSGRVSIFPDDAGNGTVPLIAWMGLSAAAGLAGALGLSLPACSPAQRAGWPAVSVGLDTDSGSAALGYSAKGGLAVRVDRRSGK